MRSKGEGKGEGEGKGKGTAALCSGLGRLLNNYCIHCNIHGMRYLAEPGRHWSERLFWLVCCVFSWWASVFLIMESWHDFTGDSALSFNVATDSVSWDSAFVSATVCEHAFNKKELAPDFVAWVNETLVKGDVKVFKKLSFFMELRYFDGTSNGVNFDTCKKIPCPNQVYDIAWKLRLSCSQLLLECKWNDKPFNCCSYFHPLHTEIGVCYSINNMHTKGARLDMWSNVSTGPGRLLVRASRAAKVFFHSPQDVPEVGADSESILQLLENKLHQVGVSIKEVVNEAGVRATTLGQRQCRFPDENVLALYDSYTFNGCIVECRLRNHLRECNCTSPLMPRTRREHMCNMSGIYCIAKNADGFGWRRLRPAWGNPKDGYYCPCLLNCESMDIHFPYLHASEVDEGAPRPFFGFVVFLTQLPVERFQRLVVRTMLDLVVNVGGTLGLLMGASLLSLAEVLHFFVLPLGRACAARWTKGGGGRRALLPPPAPAPAPWRTASRLRLRPANANANANAYAGPRAYYQP